MQGSQAAWPRVTCCSLNAYMPMKLATTAVDAKSGSLIETAAWAD
jgi:hypothetical protein